MSIPLQVMWIYSHPVSEFTAIFAKLTWLNLVVMVALLLNSFLLFQASPWLRYAVPLVGFLVICNNAAVGFDGVDYSLGATSFASFGFLLLNAPLALNRGIRELIRQPDRRWWRSAPRVRVAVPVSISGISPRSVQASTFDISQSGVFIPIKTIDELRSLDPRKRLDITLKLDSITLMHCRARIVRKSEGQGAYPQGIGVEFESLSFEQRRRISRTMAQHRLEPPRSERSLFH